MDAQGEGRRLEITAFLASWAEATVAGDVEAAARLRTKDYRATWPDGNSLTSAEELAAIAASDVRPLRIATQVAEIAGDDRETRISFTLDVSAEGPHGPFSEVLCCSMALVREDGAWRARSFVMRKPAEPDGSRRTLRSLPARLRARLARPLRRKPARSPFQDSAYFAYAPGEDYALPLSEARAPVYDEADLPVPPEDLWLGYKYPAHGAFHVRTMLEIAEASGFTLQAGDRVLDLGCGAGRMIRHLAPFARSCEIWGADISARHIYWCQRNLTPPFHFLTSTKTPHLPFPDGYFRLIYCGSLFTHIDDLAKAWLLELRRLLAPNGRVYLTIHDEDTIRQLEMAPDPSPMMRFLRELPSFKAFKHASDMFTVGRDDLSQVFYDRRYFARLLDPAFEVVSATPSAYYYQTAILARPRGG
ncbi:MAG TPA: methyltransferase domain-containing protein [Allosphingosinicella sp.]|jgi:ubiquinone/menaquinone biosynthesis C-methylase UbiE